MNRAEAKVQILALMKKAKGLGKLEVKLGQQLLSVTVDSDSLGDRLGQLQTFQAALSAEVDALLEQLTPKP